MTTKILAFSGSTRQESFNRKALSVAIEGARDAGAEVTRIELSAFPLPLYDGDLESKDGIPENGQRLKDLFMQHQGLLIASPEYNSGISGVLKNTIDWVSRPVEGRAYLAEFSGKVAGLVSASPSALGGLRGLYQLRFTLANMQVLVLPEQGAIARAEEAFAADGSLKDASLAERVRAVGARVAEMVKRTSR